MIDNVPQSDFIIPISYPSDFSAKGSGNETDIHITLFGVFRSAAKTGELSLHLTDSDPTVRAVMSQIATAGSLAPLRQLLLDSETSDPRPNALIMVSGREIGTLNGLETRLSKDDELSLLPVVHGG
jgi:molybdopterin converting factor small subunit